MLISYEWIGIICLGIIFLLTRTKSSDYVSIENRLHSLQVELEKTKKKLKNNEEMVNEFYSKYRDSYDNYLKNFFDHLKKMQGI